MNLAKANPAKRFAAESAAGRVKNGMVIGLGSRSTAEIAIRIIGEKVKDGFQIVGVPTSHESDELARSLGMSDCQSRKCP
jgi:ribose 5-phosphate isomerase A